MRKIFTLKKMLVTVGLLFSTMSWGIGSDDAPVIDGMKLVWVSSDYAAYEDEALETGTEVGSFMGGIPISTLVRPDDKGTLDETYLAGGVMLGAGTPFSLALSKGSGLSFSEYSLIGIRNLKKGDVVIFECDNLPFMIADFNNISGTVSLEGKVVLEAKNDGLNALMTSASNQGSIKRIYVYTADTQYDTGASIPVKVSGYSTFSCTSAVDFSAAEGLTVYTAALSTDNTKVTLSEVADKKVPANAGVVLKGDGDFTGMVIESAPDFTTNSLMISTAGKKVVAADGVFVLGTVEGVTGFYRFEGYLLAGKAHLAIEGSNAKNISVDFADATGISVVTSAQPKSDDVMYTLSGVRVDKPTKGLYIQNGKKVIVK